MDPIVIITSYHGSRATSIKPLEGENPSPVEISSELFGAFSHLLTEVPWLWPPDCPDRLRSITLTSPAQHKVPEVCCAREGKSSTMEQVSRSSAYLPVEATALPVTSCHRRKLRVGGTLWHAQSGSKRKDIPRGLPSYLCRRSIGDHSRIILRVSQYITELCYWG